MRSVLQALFSIILVLDMCLLGMVLAQWQKTGDLCGVFQEMFVDLFYFLREYVMLYP